MAGISLPGWAGYPKGTSNGDGGSHARAPALRIDSDAAWVCLIPMPSSTDLAASDAEEREDRSDN
jgi:hypothetical protein